MNFNSSNTTSIVVVEDKREWNFIYLFIVGSLMLIYGMWIIFSNKVITRGKIKINTITRMSPCKIVNKDDSKCAWWFSALFFPIIGLGIITTGIVLMKL